MSNENNSDAVPQGGLLARAWRAFSRPSRVYSAGFLTVLGIAIGIASWGGFNWAMELTNTEPFCLSCHEMEQNVYREYRGTIHNNNGSGVRATCPDCHVPREWIHKMKRKIQASNELWHHFLGTVDTREKFEGKRLELARSVWKGMKATDSRECRNCHNFAAMDITQQRSRARTRHLEAAEAGATCIDCHKGIAHRMPGGTNPDEIPAPDFKLSGH